MKRLDLPHKDATRTSHYAIKEQETVEEGDRDYLV
jgi:hypothetical protein